MDSLIVILNSIVVVLVIIIVILLALYFFMKYRNKNSKKEEKTTTYYGSKGKNDQNNVNYNDIPKDAINKFLDFDEIKDNMIVRKNRTQYVMVVQCQGVNYDLLSEEEKIAVEEGFVQFLNTLRFPIQLYVQTKNLNLKDIVEEYKTRVHKIESEIDNIRKRKKEAEIKGNKNLFDRLSFEERRKINVLEYGADITDYVGRLSMNQNVLQQKTYVIIPYFPSEFGQIGNYSKEEIDNICFSELYTRSQTIIRSLVTSGVTGKILDSEELSELLYVAYNRDEADLLQFSKSLDAQFNSLYSTGKDVLEKKKEMLEEKIEQQAVDLVSESILLADKQIIEKQRELEKAIKNRALELAEEYKNQMTKDLYQGTVKQINKKTTRKKASNE